MEEGIRVPPPLWPAAIILATGGVHWAIPSLPEILSGAEAVIAGGSAVTLGLALVVWAVIVQRRGGTDPDPWKPTTALVVLPPYTFSRNPIYVGFLIIQAGLGIWSGWWLAAALVPLSAWVLYRTTIRREEAFLRARFGSDYGAYCDRVRRWL